MARRSCGDSMEMALDDMRVKLAEWRYGQSASTPPQSDRRDWVLIVMHGPMALPAIEVAGCPKPALQGLSTLEGGYCHDPFLMQVPSY